MVSLLHISLQRPHHRPGMAALQKGTGLPAKEQMALCDFKLHIAECFSIQTAKTGSKKTRKNKC